MDIALMSTYLTELKIAITILDGLKKKQIILEDTPGYLTLDLRSKSDIKKIQAFWVLLEFVDKIKPEEHYPANYPSEIFFLKQGTQYEIVVLNKNYDAKCVKCRFC